MVKTVTNFSGGIFRWRRYSSTLPFFLQLSSSPLRNTWCPRQITLSHWLQTACNFHPGKTLLKKYHLSLCWIPLWFELGLWTFFQPYYFGHLLLCFHFWWPIVTDGWAIGRGITIWFSSEVHQLFYLFFCFKDRRKTIRLWRRHFGTYFLWSSCFQPLASQQHLPAYNFFLATTQMRPTGKISHHINGWSI